MKVLIIESDDGFAETLRHAFDSRGVEAVVTADGKAGMELARQGPAAIILSVELGDKLTGGYAWCQKLKKDDDLKKIPLVLTSSQATPKTFEEHRKLKVRAEEYLIKPFDPQALFSALSGHIEIPEGSGAEEISFDEAAVSVADLEESVQVEEVEALDVESGRQTLDGDDDLLKLDDAFDNLVDEPAPAAKPAPSPEEEEETALDALGGGEELAIAPDDDGGDAAALDSLGGDDEEDALAGLGEDDRTSVGPLPKPPPVPAPAPAPVRAATPAATARQTSVRTPGPAGAAAAAAAAAAATELAELRSKIEELEEKLATAERAADERGAEAQAARTTSGSRDKDYFQLKTDKVEQGKEILRLKQELNAKEQAALELQERQTQLEEQVANFEGELAKKDALAKSAQQKVEAATAQAKKAEAMLATVRAEAAQVPQLLEQIEALSAERDSVAQELGSARDEAAGDKAQLAEARGELSAERDRANSAEQERDQVRSELESGRSELESGRSELETARAELESARSELEAARGTAAATAAAASAEADELRSRLSELEGEASKNEERVVKAYQKIKGDEKVKEKTKKALAIALQLLEEHGVTADDEEIRT